MDFLSDFVLDLFDCKKLKISEINRMYSSHVIISTNRITKRTDILQMECFSLWTEHQICLLIDSQSVDVLETEAKSELWR